MGYNRHSVLAMVCHICTDINQGALPALLPTLVAHKGLSYTAAAGLIFASNALSTVVQPLFGYLGDKCAFPWLMGVGAFLACAGVALVGVLDGYWALFAAVMLCGLGVALFHPEGGRTAHMAAGARKGAGVALFSVGGNVGFALGPVLMAGALWLWGIKGTLFFLVPGLVALGWVCAALPGLRALALEARQAVRAGAGGGASDDWRAFSLVAACVSTRSMVQYGMTTFIPLYFVAVLQTEATTASLALAVFSLSSALATLLGGQWADSRGFVRVIRGCFTCLVPLTLLFPLLGHPAAALLCLVGVGAALAAPQGVAIALGQSFVPNHVGTASGITLGLAVSVGGMVAPGIGWVGDAWGLVAAMYAVAGLAVVTWGIAMLLPHRPHQRRQSAPPRQGGGG